MDWHAKKAMAWISFIVFQSYHWLMKHNKHLQSKSMPAVLRILWLRLKKGVTLFSACVLFSWNTFILFYRKKLQLQITRKMKRFTWCVFSLPSFLISEKRSGLMLHDWQWQNCFIIAPCCQIDITIAGQAQAHSYTFELDSRE